MNGTHLLLMLAHLFRKYGGTIPVEEAVYTLSFRWRYNTPSSIRRLLTLSKDLELISVNDGVIQAEFLFNTQQLMPNQSDALSKQKIETGSVSPMY